MSKGNKAYRLTPEEAALVAALRENGGGAKAVKMFDTLQKRIAYAKTCAIAREMLYEAYGMVQMAKELGAITLEEYLELNHQAVYDGINNPKYF